MAAFMIYDIDILFDP